MPRQIIRRDAAPPECRGIVEDLAAELRADRACGQPMIEEEHFERTGSVYVRVYWDRWDGLPDEKRSEIILRAYEAAIPDTARRIALALGLTVPEATEQGLLRYGIIPALRSGDPFTHEQCERAMREVGASVIGDPARPVLRCPNENSAWFCRDELARRLPGSQDVWIVTVDLGPVEAVGSAGISPPTLTDANH